MSTVSEKPSNAVLSDFCHNQVDERPSVLKERLGISVARGAHRSSRDRLEKASGARGDVPRPGWSHGDGGPWRNGPAVVHSGQADASSPSGNRRQRRAGNTEVFDEPVLVAMARELCLDMEAGGYFITTRRVDEQSVRALYEEGLRPDD